MVPDLADMDFEFDASLDVDAQYSWTLLMGDRFFVGPDAVRMPAMKPVFDVNSTNSYSEVDYPEDERYEAHHLAKHCYHEIWHYILDGEVGRVYGQGHTDSDGDQLSDVREAEIGTNPNLKDTCGISRFSNGDYSIYKGYADQELFCRWKEIDIKGNDAKDWSNIRLFREHLANQQSQ